MDRHLSCTGNSHFQGCVLTGGLCTLCAVTWHQSGSVQFFQWFCQGVGSFRSKKVVFCLSCLQAAVRLRNSAFAACIGILPLPKTPSISVRHPAAQYHFHIIISCSRAPAFTVSLILLCVGTGLCFYYA